jgi:hypothetical protein
VNWIHIIAVLFALIAVVPAVTLLSPVKVAHRAVPMLMIVASLGLWFAPTGVAIAIGLVPIAAWISARLGIEHAGYEPVDATKVVELAKKTAQRIQERVKKTPPLKITEFVTNAYPNPADEDDEPDDGEDTENDKDEPDESPAGKVTAKLEEVASDPRMPRDARQRLGQPPGVRNSTATRVPHYVPAL